MFSSIPTVEISDHTHSLSIRGPDSESDTFNAVQCDDMRAQLFIDTFMAAFAKEMEVDFAERWCKRFRIWGNLRLCPRFRANTLAFRRRLFVHIKISARDRKSV